MVELMRRKPLLRKRFINRNVQLLVLVCLSFCLILSGCTSSKKDANSLNQHSELMGNAEQPAAAMAEDKSYSSNEKTTLTSAYATSDSAAEKGIAGQGQALEGATGFAAVDSSIASAESMLRKVIFKGNLVMEVPDYRAAQTEINNLVTLAGGYILQFSENQSTLDKSGNYVIKVPANGFTSFINDLEKIKTVSPIRHNIQGQDVSEEYVDLSSRLKAKQVVEARLLAFMEKAVKTDELLSFSNELGNVQETIEQIKGRMRYLDQNVAMATVEIRLYQQGVNKELTRVGTSTLAKTRDALEGSVHALKVIAQGLLVFVAAVLPVLIVLAIIAIPIVIAFRKRARKAALNPDPVIQASYSQKVDTTEEPPKDALEK